MNTRFFSQNEWRGLLGRLAVIIVFSALVNIGFGIVLDRARLRTRTHESGLINTARRLSPDILILGTSRAKHHYDDALLSKLWGTRVYNAGFQAQGFPFARVVYEQISRVKTPNLVIVDIFKPGDEMERAHNLDPWYFDSPILRSLPPDDNSTRAVSDDWKSCLMRIPTYRFAGHTGRIFSGVLKKEEDSGFGPLSADKPMEPVVVRAIDPKEKILATGQLAALVAEIRASGAAVALCYSPCYIRDYEDWIVRPAKTFAKENGIPFLDFSDERHARFFDTRFFRDHSHMNERGAHAFSRALAAELPALLPESFPAKTSRGRE